MSDEYYAAPDPDLRRKIRARRRKRRLFAGLVKLVFWVIVLAGVFILGLGFGRTLSGDNDRVNKRVSVDQQTRTIQATLPERTITVTAPATPKAKRHTK